MLKLSEFVKYCENLEYETIAGIIQIPCGFDIETSSFYSERSEKRAIMYIWMFGISEKVTYGRTWDEFLDLIDILVKIFDINSTKKLIVYVHNLSYEFGFISKIFIWDSVFALKERKVLKCNSGGLEFRCSYLLSGLSLEKTAKNCKTKIHKMIGDLNYDLIRHSKTKLTKKELRYCEYDILVILVFIKERMERDGGLHKIPLTKTGYVRNYCREKCLYINKKKDYNKEYKALMEQLTLTKEEYLLCMRTFMGGFTHAGYTKVNKIILNVFSKDFCSSYPAQAAYNYYPMSKGKLVHPKNTKEFYNYLKKYCCMFDVQFEGLEDEFHYENYLSSHKCKIEGKYLKNNGRIVYADKLTTSITEVDFQIIKKCYSWKKMRIRNMYIYKRGYLPKELILCILKFYKDKTELKNVEGMEEEYLNNKEMLNSVYGMMVTAIIRDTFNFGENGWEEAIKPNIDEEIDKYNKNKRRFLFYPWGIYITAHGRKYLWDGIFELKEDYCYSDTDSNKGVNKEKHEEFFKQQNEKILKMLKRSMEYHKINYSLIAPKDIYGKEHPLGIWDDDGEYDIFKTLGAKRYITKKHGKTPEITIAGLNKKKGCDYLVKNYGKYGLFDYFSDGMMIPPEGTGKMTFTYIDEETQGTVTDYLGEKAEYHEYTSIHMEKQPFELSLTGEFSNYIRGIFIWETN